MNFLIFVVSSSRSIWCKGRTSTTNTVLCANVPLFGGFFSLVFYLFIGGGGGVCCFTGCWRLQNYRKYFALQVIRNSSNLRNIMRWNFRGQFHNSLMGSISKKKMIVQNSKCIFLSNYYLLKYFKMLVVFEIL